MDYTPITTPAAPLTVPVAAQAATQQVIPTAQTMAIPVNNIQPSKSNSDKIFIILGISALGIFLVGSIIFSISNSIAIKKLQDSLNESINQKKTI